MFTAISGGLLIGTGLLCIWLRKRHDKLLTELDAMKMRYEMSDDSLKWLKIENEKLREQLKNAQG